MKECYDLQVIPIEPLLIAALSVFVFMNGIFVLSLVFRRLDFADIAWGPGFLISAAAVVFWKMRLGFDGGLSARSGLALAMLSIWALRLAFHIGARNLAHSVEDARYQKLRQGWGPHWITKAYFIVFMLQGFLLWVISLPVLWIVVHPASQSQAPLGFLDFLAAAIWCAGFAIEAVSDYQLSRFKKRKDRTAALMMSGLWSWSRHPNYFGEVVQWWGIFCLSLALPFAWMTMISPLLITYLILKVSGVPMLEEQMSLRPGYDEYRRTTSIFIPFPPKKRS